jgi:hypothetical protein
MKTFLGKAHGQEWQWKDLDRDIYGQPLSRIYMELGGVSVMRKEDWPQLISFFKERMLLLDAFWLFAKDQLM